MKRFAALVVTAALWVGVTSMSGARAADCVGGDSLGFLYCGEHPELADLPLMFKANLDSRPANLSRPQVLNAVQGAIGEWNRYWPLADLDTPLSCGGFALCFDDVTSKEVAAPDGVNAIFWSDQSGFPGCTGGSSTPTGYACIWYGGPSRIIEVDIVLSTSIVWWQPDTTNAPAAVVAGDVLSVYPDSAFIGGGADKTDLQSVLTHELGHALGLEHHGADNKWPASLTDAVNSQQTMYRWSYDGTTNKRTLGTGDILGVAYLAADVRGLV